MATTQEVAAWLLDQLQVHRMLPQRYAAFGILERFGPSYVAPNSKGKPRIDRLVLAEFRRLAAKVAVWEPGRKCWVLRGPG